MMFGSALATQPRLELPEQHVVHQRGFARARYARHGSEGAQGDARVDTGEVVEPCAVHIEPADRGTSRGRNTDAFLAAEVLSGERASLPHGGGRALIDELAASCAAGRTELHHPV